MQNFLFSARNSQILDKIQRFLLRIPKFLTQIAVGCSEFQNSLYKSLLVVQKSEFPSGNYRWLKKTGVPRGPFKGGEQKTEASPSPSKGGEQKPEQISPQARSPLLWRGRGRLSAILPPFGRAGVGSNYNFPPSGGLGWGPSTNSLFREDWNRAH